MTMAHALGMLDFVRVRKTMDAPIRPNSRGIMMKRHTKRTFFSTCAGNGTRSGQQRETAAACPQMASPQPPSDGAVDCTPSHSTLANAAQQETVPAIVETSGSLDSVCRDKLCRSEQLHADWSQHKHGDS